MDKGTLYHVVVQPHGRTVYGEFEGTLVWEQGGFAQFKVTKTLVGYDPSLVNTTKVVKLSTCNIERVSGDGK